MAITTLDGLIAAFPAQPMAFYKSAIAPQATLSFYSFWTIAGLPGPGANSSDGVGGAIPTDATPGAFPFTNNNSTYLARLALYSSQPGSFMLYDRLWHNSGLSVTTVGAQTVNSTTLTRPDANGAGVEAWLQVYTALGAGSTAKTISYTDQGGTSGNTGTLQNFATTAAQDRTFRFGLAAGDTGVRSIQSFDNVATSTSGTFGLVLRRLVASGHLAAQASAHFIDAIQLGLPRVYDDACLEILWFAISTSSVSPGGSIALAQG